MTTIFTIVQLYLIVGGVVAASMAIVGNEPTSGAWFWAIALVVLLWPIMLWHLLMERGK